MDAQNCRSSGFTRFLRVVRRPLTRPIAPGLWWVMMPIERSVARSPPHRSLHSAAIFSSDENRQSKYTASTPASTHSIRTSAKYMREEMSTRRRGAPADKPRKASPPSVVSLPPSEMDAIEPRLDLGVSHPALGGRASVPATPLFLSLPSPHPSGQSTLVRMRFPKLGSTSRVSESSFICRVDTTMSSGVSPGLSSIVSVTADDLWSKPAMRTRSWWMSSSVAISLMKYSCVFPPLNSSPDISMSNSRVTARASLTLTSMRATLRTNMALLRKSVIPALELVLEGDFARFAPGAGPMTRLAGVAIPARACAALLDSAASLSSIALARSRSWLAARDKPREEGPGEASDAVSSPLSPMSAPWAARILKYAAYDLPTPLSFSAAIAAIAVAFTLCFCVSSVSTSATRSTVSHGGEG